MEGRGGRVEVGWIKIGGIGGVQDKEYSEEEQRVRCKGM